MSSTLIRVKRLASQPLVDRDILEYEENYSTIKKRKFAAKLIRMATGVAIAGFSYGFSQVFVEQSKKKITKPYGFAAFPNDYPEDISAPFWPKNVKQVPNCANLVPKKCENSVDCQQQCGPDYECLTLDQDVEFNGVLLNANERYCMPKAIKNVGCKIGVSRIVVSYNQILDQIVYRCKCLYPEFFSGYDCSDYVACRDPKDSQRVARLRDRVTDTYVNLDSVQVLKKINLHEKIEGNVGRYYCACKDLDSTLTSAIYPLKCLRDPCFPQTIGSTAAEGWKDNDTNPNMNCNCGDSEHTRLYGGKHTPCRPVALLTRESCPKLIPSGGGNDINTNDEAPSSFACQCERDQIFIPCANSYRQDSTLGTCNEGNAAFMPIKEAPQAGQCIDVCRFCTLHRDKDSNPCIDDFRTQGICRVNQEWNYRDRKSLPYTCECHAAPHAKWWLVSGNGEKRCRGYKPECRMLFGKCDPDVHNSYQGPQCCPCLDCSASGLCVWIPFCFT